MISDELLESIKSIHSNHRAIDFIPQQNHADDEISFLTKNKPTNAEEQIMKDNDLNITVQVKAEDINNALSKKARKVVVKTELEQRPEFIGVWYNPSGNKCETITYNFTSKKRLFKTNKKTLQVPNRLGWTVCLYGFLKSGITDIHVKGL